MRAFREMSLGYVKGKYWVPDLRFAAYAQWPSYTALLNALLPKQLNFRCKYSYTARLYTAETYTLAKLPSGTWCESQSRTSYHENPLRAICDALRPREDLTPLIRACILEIEMQLLRETVIKQMVLEAALERAIDALLGAIAR